MNWSSVKNMLIAMLVAANLFLIYNIVRQDRTQDFIPEAEVDGALELLEARGLSVPKDAVPLKRFDARVYESLYSEGYFTDCAEALSGFGREMLYTLPGGGITITMLDGSFVDFDTEFGFRYASAGISDADAYTDITVNSFDGDKYEAVGAAKLRSLSEKAVSFLCSRLADGSALGVNVIDSYTRDGITYLLAHQTLDGYELYSHFAVCAFSEDKLIYAHGRWYFSDVSEDHRAKLCDQVSILFNDLQALRENVTVLRAPDSNSAEADIPEMEHEGGIFKMPLPAVEAIKPCYATYWNVDKTAIYLIPAWQIEHSNSLTAVYNAISGIIYSTNK